MIKACPLLLFLTSVFVGVQCFQRQQQQQSGEQQVTASPPHPPQTHEAILELVRSDPLIWEPSTPQEQKCPCPPEGEMEEEDFFSDLGEAAFSSIGSLWAEGLLPTSLIFPDKASSENDNIEWISSVDISTRRRLQMAVQELATHSDFPLDDEISNMKSTLEELLSR